MGQLFNQYYVIAYSGFIISNEFVENMLYEVFSGCYCITFTLIR